MPWWMSAYLKGTCRTGLACMCGVIKVNFCVSAAGSTCEPSPYNVFHAAATLLYSYLFEMLQAV